MKPMRAPIVDQVKSTMIAQVAKSTASAKTAMKPTRSLAKFR
jgi:DNA-binding transcriptional regulator YhcF (GntR family)